MGLQRPIERVYQKDAQYGHYYAECSNHQYWRVADGMIWELCLDAVRVEAITECTEKEECGEKHETKVLHGGCPINYAAIGLVVRNGLILSLRFHSNRRT